MLLVNIAIVVWMELTVSSAGEVVYLVNAIEMVRRTPSATPSRESVSAKQDLAGKSLNLVHKVILT